MLSGSLAAGIVSDISRAEAILESGVKQQILELEMWNQPRTDALQAFNRGLKHIWPQHSQKKYLLFFNLTFLLVDAEERVNWVLV